MVGYRLLSSYFTLLHCIVEKKVDQNSIDSGTRMIPDDFPSDQLYAPDATSYPVVSGVLRKNVFKHTSKLRLPSVATVYELLLTNGALKSRAIP
jgi:hypothetical protein